MIRYFVEGEYLEQFESKKGQFAVTKQIAKVGDIGARHGDRSTNFEVPLTSNNARILRYTSELNNASSSNNFRKYDGKVLDDEAVISEGYFQVTSFNVSKKTIEMRFYGSNAYWFDLIKDRYLDDVIDPNVDSNYSYNLKDANHEYTEASIVDSWEKDKPYFYFLSDNGKNTYKNVFANGTTLEDWNLSYFQSFIFNRIFESVDVKVKGDIFNDPLFYSTVITASKNPLQVVSLSSSESKFFHNTNSESFVRFPTPTDLNKTFAFAVNGQNEQWSGTRFTANSAIGELDMLFNITFGVPENASQPSGVEIRYSYNGGAFSDWIPFTSRINTIGFTDNSDFLNVAGGDTFDFEFQATPGSAGGAVFVKGGANTYVEIEETGRAPEIIASDFVPHIKQTDFIKDILFRLGAITEYDTKTRTLTINKFESIDNNRVNAPDWTDKIDMSKDISTDFTKVLNGYGKRSVIRYKDDTEKDSDLAISNAIYGYGLGDGVITVNNDFLSDEKDIYKSPFAATQTRRTFQNEWFVPSVPYYKLSGQDDDTPTYDNNEISSRVLVVEKLPVSSFNNAGLQTIEIDFGNQYNRVGYGYFTKTLFQGVGSQELNNLEANLMYDNSGLDYNIGQTIIERNYSLYKKVLDNPYYIPIYFNLTPIDIQNVDFLTPIYLKFKYDSGYYYIDSIEQYKGDGTTTKVNLVKI